MTALCSIDGCVEPVRSHGWCKTHWGRWRRTGNPLPVGPTHVPLAPLLAATRAESISAFAAISGHGRRVIQRWNATGIPVFTADALALQFERHPIEIWGAAWLGVNP